MLYWLKKLRESKISKRKMKCEKEVWKKCNLFNWSRLITPQMIGVNSSPKPRDIRPAETSKLFAHCLRSIWCVMSVCLSVYFPLLFVCHLLWWRFAFILMRMFFFFLTFVLLCHNLNLKICELVNDRASAKPCRLHINRNLV